MQTLIGLIMHSLSITCRACIFHQATVRAPTGPGGAFRWKHPLSVRFAPATHSGSGARCGSMDDPPSQTSMTGATTSEDQPPVFSKDREPPPSFDGSDPEQFKVFLRDLALWEWETDVPKVKHAVKLLRQLSGPAKAAANEVDLEVIKSEGGLKAIVAKLEEHFRPHLEAAMPKAFERAIYGDPRKARESIQEFIIRMDKCFKELDQEGVKLSDEVRGYVMFRQSSLNQTQEDQVVTWTQGKYDRSSVVQALRKFEKISKDKGSKHYVTEECDILATETGLDDDFDAEEDFENYVFIGEGDLDQIYDEDELQTALATYQQVRRAIKDQKNARGFPFNKGKGKGKNFKGTSQATTKVHIEQLKLRTRCARCGQIGHWAKECTGPMDDHARQKSSSGSSIAPSSVGKGGAPSSAGKNYSSAAMSGKSGFCEVDGEVKGSTFHSMGKVGLTLRECYDMAVHKGKNPVRIQDTSQFCGLHTMAEHGVVDTAAQNGLVGLSSLRRLEQALHGYGLKIKWTSKSGCARGVGGAAKVAGVAEIPLGLGGVNGILEATVVEDEVPLLIPVNLLKSIRAVVDIDTEELVMKKFDTKIPMFRMKSGHFSVSVLDFDDGGWTAPQEAVIKGRRTSDFVLHAAMLSTSEISQAPRSSSHDREASHASTHFLSYDVAPCAAALACAAAARHGGDGAGGRRRGTGLASKWIALWISAVSTQPHLWLSSDGGATFAGISGAIRQAGADGLPDSTWSSIGSEEVQQATTKCSGTLRTSTAEFGRRWESIPAGGVVPRLSHEVEGGNYTQAKAGIYVDSEPYGKTQLIGDAIDYDLEPRSEQPDQCADSSTISGQVSRCNIQNQGSGVSVRFASGSTGGAQRGSNQGSTLLQVPEESLRVLPVGSGGGAEAAGGTSSSPRGHRSEERGDRGVEGHAEDEGRELKAEGDQHVREPVQDDSGSKADDRAGNDPRGCTSLRDCERTREGASGTSGVSPKPVAVGDDGGRRRTDARGDAQSRGACRDSASSVGAEAEYGSSTEQRTRFLAREAVRKEDLKAEDLEEIAPWATKLSNAKDWNTAVLQQLQSEDLPEAMRTVHPCYWIKEASAWKYRSGTLPLHEIQGQEVCVAVTPDVDEVPLENIDCTLQKGCRKRIARGMSQVWSTVSEVYSVPRLSREAARQGLKEGTSFDIKTGFDFRKGSDRRRCWKVLQEEDPDLVLVCPPCGPFSAMQRLNFPKMKTEKAICIVAEGLEHLEFSMKIFEWQVRRGRWALFEHPRDAESWNEPCVHRVMSLPGVRRVVGDQCQFGLQVRPDEALSRKPTGFMSNSSKILARLQRKCPGDHPYQPLEGGRAKLAEQYPHQLCREIIQGLKEEMKAYVCVLEAEDFAEEDDGERDLEDMLEDAVEEAGRPIQAARPRAEDEEEGEEKDEEEEPAAGGLPRGVSEADKRKIKRLHANLGHPSTNDFCRALRMAKARTEVIQYVKQEFKCSLCQAHQLPKAARPAVLPRHFESGKIVGVDIVYFPGRQPRESVPVLNIIDWSTCYQMLEPLECKTAQHVWTKFHQTWARTFGIPEVVVVDQGREFLGEFGKKINEAGALVRTIGARAPWQQGRTERHGGLAKQVFLKVRDEVQPETEEEWKQCIYATEAAKNRLFNRSGYSPAQRQIGANIRLPGSLAGDDVYDGSLMRSTATTEVRRLLEIRDKAMEEFMKHSSKEAIMRAERARPRVSKHFEPGAKVFVFRKPLPRRGDDVEREHRRAVWCGPGVVILQENSNVWISMRGELWKCALEQVRAATPEEEEACTLLREEFEDLAKELKRKGSKRGFKDITRWAIPEDHPEDEEELERKRQRRAEPEEEVTHEESPGGAQAEDIAEEQAEEEQPQQQEESSSSSTSSTSSSTSQEEPERETEEAIALPPTQLQPAADSVHRNEMLDDTGLRRGAAYGPERGADRWKERLSGMRFKPYGGGWFSLEEDEFEAEMKDKKDEDHWEVSYDQTRLRRYHIRDRRGPFGPSERKGCPINPRYLASYRVSVRKYQDGEPRVEVDDWRRARDHPGPKRSWVGYTEFVIKDARKLQEPFSHFAAGKGSDEVREEDIKPEDWEGWRTADAEEWKKVESSGAVKVLSEEESRSIEAQLQECGEHNRILPSRVVRRWKPAEQPGQPPSMKSRWCIRGDKDPDLLNLERYAPTVTTAVVAITMQVAANMGFRGTVGDLKNAFMQSDKLHRKWGRLFCRQPRRGLDGLGNGQLIEILAGAYGLGDAPAHWRKSLKRVILELGYVQSDMDPCVFKLMGPNGLDGLMIVEVDDILTLGNERHFTKMQELQQRFKFGKFMFMDEHPEGVGFNGRRIKSDLKGGYKVDMEKFVSERLQEVPLEAGRSKDKEAAATDEERSATRAAIGAVTWAAKEGRPDCAAAASLIAGCLNQLKIQDILDLNKTIKEVKKDAGLSIPIQAIEPSRVCWGVVTDASWANIVGGASQGAFGVLCYDRDVIEKGKGTTNLQYWKNGKIHRVVNSTLAAETQALSKGLGELAWTATVYAELTQPDFDLRRWSEEAKRRRLTAFAKEETSSELKHSVCLVNAKSLYDYLAKETVGTTEDRRTAIEMQVIRQSLCETNTAVRWIPHTKMIVDCLTKRCGNRGPLTELLSTRTLDLIKPT